MTVSVDAHQGHMQLHKPGLSTKLEWNATNLWQIRDHHANEDKEREGQLKVTMVGHALARLGLVGCWLRAKREWSEPHGEWTGEGAN